MSYNFKSFSSGNKILASDLNYNFNLIKSNSIEIKLLSNYSSTWTPTYSSGNTYWRGWDTDGYTNWFKLLGSPTSMSECPDAVIFKFETPIVNDALSNAANSGVRICLSEGACLNSSTTMDDGWLGYVQIGNTGGEVIGTSLGSFLTHRQYAIGAPFYNGKSSNQAATIDLGLSQSSSSGWFPYISWGSASSSESYQFTIYYKCYGIYLF